MKLNKKNVTMSIKIVQFTHPGGQYVLTQNEKKSGIKEWNISNHRRKFLIAEGQYVTGGTLSVPQELLFWGEWEPDSEIVATYSVSDPVICPIHLHSPFLRLDKKGKVIKSNSKLATTPIACCTGKLSPTCSKVCNQFENTDPFVFGDSFYYSLCKQDTFVSMRNLDVGSIILFGSTISAKRGGPYFVLDTVFVVGDKQAYTVNNYKKDLAGFIPNHYAEIMGFNALATKVQLTCYKGATFNDPINGMYSFVPCEPAEVPRSGFSRVMLKEKDFSSIGIPVLKQNKKNPKFISDNLNSSPNFTESDLATNKLVWDKICDIVASQGCQQGMNFKYIIK